MSYIAVAGFVMTAVGAGVSAYGSYQQGSAESEMMKYKSGVALINKRIAEENADYASYTGEVKAQRIGLAAGQKIAQMKADQGASGLDVNSGSPADIRDSQRGAVQQDEATVRSNAAREAFGFKTKAASDEAESQIDIMAGTKSKEAGTISALGSLASGASSVASKWIQAKSAGIGSGYKPVDVGSATQLYD